MIACVQGRLEEKAPTHVVVLVGGVGYRLFVPLSTYYELPEAGAEVALRAYTHVREDVLALYGFKTATEELLFQRLISVAGVGPALALKIMSGLEPQLLIESIRQGDRRRLNAVPGVGKKTAERLILELQDKMPDIVPLAPGGREAAVETGGSLDSDLISALTNLGYPRHEAEKSVRQTLQETGDVGFETALKNVLRQLAG